MILKRKPYSKNKIFAITNGNNFIFFPISVFFYHSSIFWFELCIRMNNEMVYLETAGDCVTLLIMSNATHG